MTKRGILRSRIPRPVQAIFCAACAAVLAIVYYIALGCPTLTFEQEFRRAEKVNLVGPSKIVHRLDDCHDDFDSMLVGESEQGISFFCRRKNDGLFGDTGWHYLFTHTEKTGDITVAAAPNIFGSFWGNDLEEVHITRNLPVYVFTENKNAVRAEIRMEIEGTYTQTDGEDGETHNYVRQFSAEGELLTEGVFLLDLESSDSASAQALYALSCLASGSTEVAQEHKSMTIPVIVRLYDENDQLICEQTVVINGQ